MSTPNCGATTSRPLLHTSPTLDTVREVPGAAGSTGAGRAVAVASGTTSGGGGALGGVVDSSRTGLVFALTHASLGLRAASVRRGSGRGRRVRVLLDAVIGAAGHTGHIARWRLFKNKSVRNT